MMGNLVKVTHAAVMEGRNPSDFLTSFVRECGAKPHMSNEKSPFELLMGHTIKTRHSNPPTPARNSDVDSKVRRKDKKQKQKYKEYVDKRSRAREVEINPGDYVVIK